MAMGTNLLSKAEIDFLQLCFRLCHWESDSKHIFTNVRRLISISCITIVSIIASAQESKDSSLAAIQFSGTVSFTSNGISPIPAFSLEKPAILGFLSIRRKRFSYHPEIAFSSKGIPWFFNNFFRYKLIEKPKFQFQTGLNWAISYSYPEVMQGGVNRTIAKAERFLWLELVPRYTISEKVAISSTTFSGYNFEPGSVKRINFISLVGNITKIKIYRAVYSSFFPQIFYLNLDNKSNGIFVSGLFGIGHNKLPLFLSTQINQTLVTTISPDPGFKWNISLSYSL
jgi:hypothetical protein